MSDRALLAGWLVAVVAATFVHDPAWLGGLTILVLALLGRAAWPVLSRALIAVAFVNLAVSVAWIGWAWIEGRPWLELVLRLNLRVLLIAVLTLAVVRRLDPVRAVEPWPSLRFLVVLVLGQLRVLSRLLADYRDAYASRSPSRPGFRLRLGAAGRQAAALLEKAELRSNELNQSMRARGFFDDRG